MVNYEWKKEHKRKSDGRWWCVVNGKTEYLSRVIFCNQYGLTLEDIKHIHIHHIDKNIDNNNPKNLLALHQSEHNKKYHRTPKGLKRTDEFKKRCSEKVKQDWKNGVFKNRKRIKPLKYQEKFEDVWRLFDLGKNQVEISKTLNIPRTTIRNILKRR